MSDIEWWVYLAVLGGLLLVSFLLDVLVRVAAPPGTPAKKHGLMALFIGLDDRTSTSKLQPLLWTYAILWALISLLAGGGVEEFEEALGAGTRGGVFPPARRSLLGGDRVQGQDDLRRQPRRGEGRGRPKAAEVSGRPGRAQRSGSPRS